MAYKEYKASEGKVLFNIDSFTWGNQILCKVDTVLNLIEVNKEDAEEYQQKYKEEVERLITDPAVKDELIAMPRLVRTMSAEVESVPNELTLEEENDGRMMLVEKMKTELLSELMTKGYNLNAAGTPESNIEEHIIGLLNK